MGFLDGILRRRRALSAEEAAAMLGCRPDDLRIHEEEGRLHPLPGMPAAYDRADVEECARRLAGMRDLFRQFDDLDGGR